MKPYKTLVSRADAEFIINKSRFIGHGKPVETEEEALAFLAEMRETYKDATHNCYAYNGGANTGVMRYSDDGEPGGTAGMPIIEVLKAREVTNCCVVVTRYFGGVLLGAGGLVRAYSRGAAEAVNACGVGVMHPTLRALVDVPYPLLSRVESALKTAPVIDEDAITESLGLAGGRRTAELLSAAARHDAKSALDAFAALWRDGKDPAVLLSDLCALMRDVLVLSVAPKGGRELLSGAYDDATLKKFARSFTKAELLRAMERVQEAIVSLRDNPSPRTAVELCLVSLCDLTLCDGLPELRARVSRLEAGAANAPAAPASQPENAPAQDKGPEKAAAAKEPPQAAREGYIAPAEEEEERPPFPDEPPPERRYEDAGAPPWAQEEEPPQRAEKAAERTEKAQEPTYAAEAAPAPEYGCAPAEDISEEEGARVTASGPCWDDVVSHLKGRVPVGYWNLLTDPLQVRGEFTDVGLHVAIAKGFAANMLTKPDMMDKFRTAAAEIMGHGVPVNVTEMDSDEKIATRSIEELRRFKEVKFT